MIIFFVGFKKKKKKKKGSSFVALADKAQAKGKKANVDVRGGVSLL